MRRWSDWLGPILVLGQLPIIVGVWYSYHAPEHPFLGHLLTGEAWSLAWGRLAGFLAAYALLVQVLLIARLPWLVRALPHDRLTRWHHAVGFVLVLALLAHPVLLLRFHAGQAGIGLWPQFLDFCRTWEEVLAAVIGTGLIGAALIPSVLVLKRRIGYEAWYRLHLILYPALALAFGHQLAVGGTCKEGPSWFAGYWIALHGLGLLNLLWFRLVRPLWVSWRQGFRVQALVEEAPGVVSVHIGGRNLARFPAIGGQFVIVRFLARGFWSEAHPFSLSEAPDGQRLRLTVKALGDFTRRIPRLPVGTRVLLDGPHGAFTARRCRGERALLIAGGIGITPLRAMIPDLLQAGKTVLLVLAARDRAGAALLAEVETLAHSTAGRLQVHAVLSDDPAWTGWRGFVNAELLQQLVPDLAGWEVFLCGPPPMMRLVRAAVRSLGLPGRQFHDERFAL